MAARKVFGRRRVDFEGKTFTIELRTDGIFVRKLRGKKEWRMPLEALLNHAKLQPEFFYGVEKSQQTESVPNL